MEDDHCLGKRVKRQKIDKSGRAAALERLKLLKGSKNKCEVGEVKNVYEYIDEKEYSKTVLKRQNDDWLENPGDGYFEDGREIFDDDEEEDSTILESTKRQSSNKKRGMPKPKSSSKNILEMMANMPGKKKKANEESNILNLLEQSLDSEEKAENVTSKKSETVLSKEYLKMLSNSSSSVPMNDKNKKELPQPMINDGMSNNIMDAIMDNDWSQEISFLGKDESFNQETQSNIESQISNFESKSKENMIDECISDEALQDPSDKTKENTSDWKMDVTIDDSRREIDRSSVPVEEKEDLSALAKEFLDDEWESGSQNVNVSLQNVSIDKSDLPLTLNKNGERVLKFYWWDSYEDPVKQPGVVYLFGKVYYEKKKMHLSCCVSVENIPRRIFLLPREKKIDSKTGEVTNVDVKLLDVYQEFNEKIATPNKIMNFKSRKINLKYAFDLSDVPLESEYLEIKYPSTYPKLPQDLSGETFSRVFGTNVTSLELLLLERKIKGPCWLEVKNFQGTNVQSTWCKFEGRCTRAEDLAVSETATPPPPMVLMTITIRSVVNSRMDNEIVMIGALVHNQYRVVISGVRIPFALEPIRPATKRAKGHTWRLTSGDDVTIQIDKPAPKPPFNSHFCTITRSPNLSWPPNAVEILGKYKKTDVIVHQAEKSLLNYFLTKLFTIDPDVIIGHDLFGFTLDTLVQRIQSLKVPNWSRIGRLKRAIVPRLNGKQTDKSVTCGRLVCDVVTSARELIRARSYDLSTLCKEVLGMDENARQDFSSEEIVEKFENASTLRELVGATMDDASYILKIIYEMNVLPLSLQITKIAGNVMSKTLLGGRSERNEFLLLHAFTEKNYLVPDKYLSKRPQFDDETEIEESGRNAKKKPQYTGGLVLEPKKGFYDKFILLMDFNSLYPSIIQEYNICFTTVSRKDIDGEEKANVAGENQGPGILPIEIQKLVETRREVKSLMKGSNLTPDLYMQYNIRQTALKLTANSMYGCLGFTHSRFYAKHLAALVTSKGREILLNAKGVVEKMNYEVIYGDTDSIMINTNCNNYEEVFVIGQKIKEEINKLYKHVELEIDGVFKYMLLLKKKKYAAVTCSKKANGEIVFSKEYKGLDIVRRDWCQLSAEVGRNVLNQILSDLSPEDRIGNIKKHLERIAEDLKNGKVPVSLLAITKQLTKNPEDYSDAKSLPHLQVALRMNSKGGKKFRAGNTISYVICDNGTSLPPGQRAYHLDEVKADPQLLVDFKYYLTQQIHPVVSRLCEPIDEIDSAFIAECLGLDPASYRKAIKKTERETESNSEMIDHVMVNDMQAFKRCEPFSFVCKKGDCGTVNFMDGPTRDNVLALSKCRNPACTGTAVEFLSCIANELTLKIRNHVGRFYQNWLICEDPACTNRTQRVPMRFSNSFPVCTLCRRGAMYREFTSSDLYYQLKFYKFIFTLDRSHNNASPELKEAYKLLRDKVSEVLDDSGYNSLDLAQIFGKNLKRRKNEKSLQNSFLGLKI